MGGAERAVVKLANHWAEHGNDVSIITITDDSQDFYPLHASINRIKLGLMEPRITMWQKIKLQMRRMHALPKAIRAINPDVVISFQTETNLLALETSAFYKARLIISERTNIHHQKIKKIPTLLRRALYPFARKIVFVSQGAADAYDWIKNDKKHVIYNPVEPVEPAPAPARDRKKEIIALGRLIDLKGYDLLIKAFAKIAAQYPDWNLKIYGEGESRQKLESLIRTEGLDDRVELPGTTQNVPDVMSLAGIFVLSSYYEGMPNALMEAMSHGVACISFDCPFGPSELITHGKNGLLVDVGDIDGLSQNLSELISNPEKRQALGRAAEKINADLSLEKITAEWDCLIKTS